MVHKLFKLTEKLYNTPHLVTPGVLDSVIGYLEKRNNTPDFAITASVNKGERYLAYNEDTKVGVISVDGPLTYISYNGICGEEGCSYQQINESFDQLAEAGATTIVLDCDGPGGEAYGMFETGRDMRNKADALGITLISYVDGMAASATYGIAASSHKLITNPGSQLGSIGVVVKLRNVNKALQSMGIEDSYIYAGDAKIPFNDKGEFTESFKQDIQNKVDVLYKDFIGYVSEMRGIDEKVVRDTKANMFLSGDAVSLGLADSAMTREEFSNYLADLVDDPMLKNTLFKSKTAKASLETERENEKMEKLEQLQAEFATLQASLVTTQAKVTELTSALESKNAELTAVNAALAVFKTEQEAQLKAQLEAKKLARKTTLSSVVGDVKGAELSETLADLSDEAFELVLSTFKTSAESEKITKAFTELGVGGEGDQLAVDGTRKLIDQKYNK